MGAGYYLKNGWRDSSGWCVKKYHGQGLAVAGLEFTDTARGIAAAPAAAPAKAAATIDGAGLFSIEEHTHTQKGFQMFIAIMGARLERETFAALLDPARALGGWYSKPWGGPPGRCGFKDAAMGRQVVAVPIGRRVGAGRAGKYGVN